MANAKTLHFCPPDWRKAVSKKPILVLSGARRSPHFVDDALGRFLRCDWGQISRSQTLQNNQSVKRRDPNAFVFGQYPASKGDNPLIILHQWGKQTLIGVNDEMGNFSQYF